MARWGTLHSIGFILTNFKFPAGKVVQVYNGSDVENPIKEEKNSLRLHKASCGRFVAD